MSRKYRESKQQAVETESRTLGIFPEGVKVTGTVTSGPHAADSFRREDSNPIGTVVADVLIAIPTCEADKPMEDTIRRTWGKDLQSTHGAHVVEIVFFSGKTLGVPDDYDSLPIKIKAICQWATSQTYQWMLKADTDAYIWLDRIMASGFEHYDYSGYCNPKFPDAENYASGGAAYWLSRRAMRIIANAELTEDTAEDRWVGKTLYDAGIRLHRNPNHAHGRHDEANSGELLTLHPCDVRWMEELYKL